MTGARTSPKRKAAPGFVESDRTIVGNGWKIVDLLAHGGASIVVSKENVWDELNNWDADVSPFTDRRKVKLGEPQVISLAAVLRSAEFKHLANYVPALARACAIAAERRQKVVSELASDGALPFQLAAELLLLSVGRMVVIGVEVPMAGKLTSAKIETSWFGSQYLSLEYSVLQYAASGVARATAQTFVSEYDGTRTLRQLEIELAPSEETLARLSRRGRRAYELSAGCAYVRLTGNIARRSWYQWVEEPATGRVIVDPGGHAAVEPNEPISDHTPERMPQGGAGVTDGTALTETDFATFDPYVVVFSFAAKRWGRALIDQISDITFRMDAFHRLVLDEANKRLVMALVRNADPTVVSDIVDGKGGGCVMLFHGAPGRGKTLTAETIAEVLQRPLYSVTVGELGTEPAQLETRLGRVLRLAERWKAVLLLDEADVFLEQRQAGDVVRNAMVGTFLRLCEYYNGVLILTTNRVKEIDEAFYSRVSLALRYDDFDAARRAQVVKNLLAVNSVVLSQTDEAKIVAVGGANGRQIKNAIRIARFIANEECRDVAASDIVEMLHRLTSFTKATITSNGAGRPVADA